MMAAPPLRLNSTTPSQRPSSAVRPLSSNRQRGFFTGAGARPNSATLPLAGTSSAARFSPNTTPRMERVLPEAATAASGSLPAALHKRRQIHSAPPRRVGFQSDRSHRSAGYPPASSARGKPEGLADSLLQQIKHLKSSSSHLDSSESLAIALATAEQACNSLLVEQRAKSAAEDELERLRSETAGLHESLSSAEDRLTALDKLNHVKSALSISKLQQSVLEIENTARRYDPSLDLSLNRPKMPVDVSEFSESERILHLVQRKFRALEDLVFVLKKRVLTLEMNEDLAEAVKQYGTVKDLLNDNLRLKDENAKLRIREARFSTDALLKRRRLSAMSSQSLQSLVIALQNELAASRKAALEPRTSDVKVEDGLPEAAEQIDVEKLIGGQDDDLDIQEAKAFGGLRGSDDELSSLKSEPLEQALSRKVNVLQLNNDALRDELASREKLEQLIARASDAVEKGFSTAQQEAGLDQAVLKQKKLGRMALVNKDLISECNALQTAIEAKESQVQVLHDTVESLTEHKASLENEVQRSIQNAAMVKTEQERVQNKLVIERQRCRAALQLAKVLSCAVLSAEDESSSTDTASLDFVGKMFQDVLQTYTSLSGHAVKLQKVVRGHRIRKLLRDAGNADLIPSLRAPMLVAEDDVGPVPPSSLLPRLVPLARVLVSEASLNQVMSLRSVLRASRTDMHQNASEPIRNALRGFGSELGTWCSQINSAVATLAKKPDCHKSVDARPKMRQCASQHEPEEDEAPAAGKKK